LFQIHSDVSKPEGLKRKVEEEEEEEDVDGGGGDDDDDDCIIGWGKVTEFAMFD
jgi:hypothetical protein